jgi:hypothetical protein
MVSSERRAAGGSCVCVCVREREREREREVEGLGIGDNVLYADPWA